MRRGTALWRATTPAGAWPSARRSPSKPLHLETLAGSRPSTEAAFQLVFRCVELLGRAEAGERDARPSALLRLLTPVAKLLTAQAGRGRRQRGARGFGGAGYVEDTGLARLLRDAQVLPIWEGTTNVLGLDSLRAMSAKAPCHASLEMLRGHARKAAHPMLEPMAKRALDVAEHAEAWLAEATQAGPAALEAGARRFALTLGRAMQLALLCEQAQWDLEQHKDGRTAAVARRLAAEGVDLLLPPGALAESRALALDSGLAPED